MDESEPPDLRLLQTFFEVARSGSVTKAARLLGRSQPAISYRLRSLEQELGVPLFEKVGRRLMLTEYGHRLQTECLELMTRSQHIRERVVGAGEQIEGTVTIGTLPTVASHLLAPELTELFETHPGIALVFRFDRVDGLLDRLRSGELDLVVVVGHIEAPRLHIDPLGEAKLVAAMATGLEAETRISPKKLRRYKYLAYGQTGDPTFDLIEQFAKKNELENKRTPQVPHIETLRELAAAGSGYTILPHYTLKRDVESGRLVALAVDGLTTKVRVSIGYRRSQSATPAQSVVRSCITRSSRGLE